MVYIMLGLKSFANQLAYRFEVWIRTLGNLVTIIIQVSIWQAVMVGGAIEGIQLQEMITYSVLSTLISTVLMTEVASNVGDQLRTGNISKYLMKPMSYSLSLFSEGFGRVIYGMGFIILPTFTLSWLMYTIVTPSSIIHLLSFICAVGISIVLSFLLGYLISLISFWFLTHLALDWTMKAFIMVFSGQFLPLWFFPDWLHLVAMALPFQYLNYIPLALYLGQIPDQDIAKILVTGSMWVVGFIAIVRFLWWKALRSLVVQGG